MTYGSEVIDALRAIHDKHGVLNVDDALEEAASPDSPLHKLLEWDDTIAGAQYRRAQLQLIIRKVKIQIIRPDQDPRSVRMFVSRPSMRGQGPRTGYEHIEEVMSDHDKKNELLQSALNDLNIFQKRYAILTELSDVFKAVDAFVEQFSLPEERKSA